MNARIAVMALFLASICTYGRAQQASPTITLGGHVLRLGMPESTVLEQLGGDFVLRNLPAGTKLSWSERAPESTWAVEKKTESGFVVTGMVAFDGHKLVSASHNSEAEVRSANSLFYAVDLASKSLEQQGYVACDLSTTDDGYTLENGSVSSKAIDLKCGSKGMSISLETSDAPDHVPTSITVIEWLRAK